MRALSDRATIWIATIAASAGLVAVLVAFSNVAVAGRIADNAEELHWSNATLGTAALARAAAGQAAAFDLLARTEPAAAEAASVARDELEHTTAALVDLAAAAPPELHPALTTLVAALEVRPLDREKIDAAYEPVEEGLGERISTLEMAIARGERVGNYVAAAIRILLVLVIPAIALLMYRRSVVAKVRNERLRLEALLEAERELSQAKDDFLAGVSHEFRTPLTGIYGFSELLLDAPADRPADRDVISLIHSEAASLTRMVEDLIVAARLDQDTLALELDAVEMGQIVETAARRIRRSGASIDVVGDQARVIADKGRTLHILTNLLSNAARHGGPSIRVEFEDRRDVVHCRVIDDGDGVAESMEERLFQRFIHRGAETLTTGSLGMGTWVARELARRMGGDLSYLRDRGRTVFTLTLPAARIEPVKPVGSPIEAVR